MATRSKHPFVLRENPDFTHSILARRADGKEVWFGNYSLPQSAIRWGMSHRNQNKFPCAVMKAPEDPFGFSEASGDYAFGETSTRTAASHDPVNRSILKLLDNCGIEATNQAEVAEFLGKSPDDLEQVLEFQNRPEGEGNRLIWQPKGI